MEETCHGLKMTMNSSGLLFCELLKDETPLLEDTSGVLWFSSVPFSQLLPYSAYMKRTCTEIKTTSQKTGQYVIDPDGLGGEPPFMVHCDMADRSGVGVTVVGHDSEARTLATPCEKPGCYSKDITYNDVTINQLIKLTEASTACEQFIKYECYNSKLFIDGDGWWVSRDGRRMDYWGGSTPTDGGCACSVEGMCEEEEMCNCDANEKQWLKDEGLLEFKQDLPVIQLRFGDLGDGREEGYHTLGKLKCFG